MNRFSTDKEKSLEIFQNIINEMKNEKDVCVNEGFNEDYKNVDNIISFKHKIKFVELQLSNYVNFETKHGNMEFSGEFSDSDEEYEHRSEFEEKLESLKNKHTNIDNYQKMFLDDVEKENYRSYGTIKIDKYSRIDSAFELFISGHIYNAHDDIKNMGANFQYNEKYNCWILYDYYYCHADHGIDDTGIVRILDFSAYE
jgi:hypothetical protein